MSHSRIGNVALAALAGISIMAVVGGCSTAPPQASSARFESTAGTPLIAADAVAYYSFGMDVVFARDNVAHDAVVVDADAAR